MHQGWFTFGHHFLPETFTLEHRYLAIFLETSSSDKMHSNSMICDVKMYQW